MRLRGRGQIDQRQLFGVTSRQQRTFGIPTIVSTSYIHDPDIAERRTMPNDMNGHDRETTRSESSRITDTIQLGTSTKKHAKYSKTDVPYFQATRRDAGQSASTLTSLDHGADKCWTPSGDMPSVATCLNVSPRPNSIATEVSGTTSPGQDVLDTAVAFVVTKTISGRGQVPWKMLSTGAVIG